MNTNSTINSPQGVQNENGVAITATPNVSLFKNLCSYTSKTIGFEEIVRLVKYDSDVKDKTEAYRKTLQAVGKRRPMTGSRQN